MNGTFGQQRLSKFARRLFGGDGVVDGVEDLVAEPVLLEAEMDDLAEVARIDIAPGVALARHRVGEEGRERLVFVRLDDVADSQRIDVGARSARRRRARSSR